jgi:hypothetical protein
MSNKIFTIEEREKLRVNPYVKNVTDKSITYTEEFREYFINQYNLGKLPKEIFKEAGFDINILGNERIKSNTKRFKKMSERIEGFKDTREENSGRSLKRELTDDEKIVKLKEENLKLKQQLEFLKKMEFLARQAKQDKSKR